MGCNMDKMQTIWHHLTRKSDPEGMTTFSDQGQGHGMTLNIFPDTPK